MITGAVPRQILQDELEELRVAIIAHHISAGQKASGKTAASMHVEVTETRGTLFGRSAFGTLETGRKAGKVPQRLFMRESSRILFNTCQLAK